MQMTATNVKGFINLNADSVAINRNDVSGQRCDVCVDHGESEKLEDWNLTGI